MNLNLPIRQIIVNQYRAVNARIRELDTLISQSEQPNKEQLLFEIYKARGDKDAVYNDEDPEPEPSSDDDEEENVTDRLAEDIREGEECCTLTIYLDSPDGYESRMRKGALPDGN